MCLSIRLSHCLNDDPGSGLKNVKYVTVNIRNCVFCIINNVQMLWVYSNLYVYETFYQI